MYIPVAILLSFMTISHAIPKHHVVPRQVTQVPGYTKLTSNQVEHLHNKGFGPTIASEFQNKAAFEDDEDDSSEEELHEDSSVASTQIRRPVFAENAYYQNAIPVVQARPQPQVVKRPPPQQYRPQQYHEENKADKDEKEEEEEKEEPDRLSILLPNSKFDCNGKNTGYYADEDLGCEVFHYCNENDRHSWICPEGFTFHQVHLICMPPGADNICAKSSQFHFVNDFLYKPINLEEHQTRPNVTLKYADRYFPEGYPENSEDSGSYHRKQPIRVGLPQQQQQVVATARRPTTVQFSPTIRPETTIGQVFRSPEEVNISLQQRRPQFVAQRYQESVDY